MAKKIRIGHGETVTELSNRDNPKEYAGRHSDAASVSFVTDEVEVDAVDGGLVLGAPAEGEDRRVVRIKNPSGDTAVYIKEDPEGVGYPLLPGEEFVTCTEAPVYAVAASATVSLRVLVELF